MRREIHLIGRRLSLIVPTRRKTVIKASEETDGGEHIP